LPGLFGKLKDSAQMMMLQLLNSIIKLQFTARNGIQAGGGL
jgi:hypothetical protein